MPSTTNQALRQFFDVLLGPEGFKDYCPNGLQVEGQSEVKTIVSGVTASLALIEAAVRAKADAILVHHGLFWRGEVRVTGWLRQRLALLLAHDINLYAYHLPLDAHPQWGNNAQLAQQMGWMPSGQRFGEQGLGWIGLCPAQSLRAFATQIEQTLGRYVVVVGEPDQWVQKVAWCTGGAQGYFESAIAAGVDVFVTGEISEPQAHYAREMGVAYVACGHHASERYGAWALAAHAAEHFGLRHEFIDIDNPA